MSDHFVHALNGCDGKSGQSLNSYHSVWMSHWAHRSCEEIEKNPNCSSSSFINMDSCRTAKEYQSNRGKEIVSSVYEPAEGLRETPNGSSKIKTECLQMTPTGKGTEIPSFQSLPTDSNFAMPRSVAKDLNISTTDMVQRGLGHGNQRISSLLLLGRTAPASEGVKIQSLGSSTDSEGEEKVGDDNPLGRSGDSKDLMASDYCVDSRGKRVRDDSDLKNESSAETDTMDLDDFKEKNQLSSVNSSPSSKGINLELPALPASDNVNANSSRTQSLDIDRLLAHTEQPSQSESECCRDGSSIPEPTSRWIKLLKLTSEPFAFGTKSSNMDGGSHHERESLSLEINVEGCGVRSETVTKLVGKELMVTYKTAAGGESSSTGKTEHGRDAPASLSWIRRWCHNQSVTPKKKPETVVLCEPQSSKLASEDLQGKQVPSIAAMALMGKAMSGFQPCELERKGSLMLWNIRRD